MISGPHFRIVQMYGTSVPNDFGFVPDDFNFEFGPVTLI